MAKVRPDFSFVREGRPLSAWLIDLVADDRPTREKAGDVLQGMSFGVAYAHTELNDLDWEEYGRNPGQRERFAAAVRDAVAGPEFPTADFVRRLILYRMALGEDSRRRAEASCDRREEESDKYIKRIGRRLEAAGDDAERAEAARRLCRWFCATVARDIKASQAVHEGAEELGRAGMASHLVFEALDVALLADRPGLRLMLDPESNLRHQALSALERIGPPAIEFAPLLIDGLDAAGDRYYFDADAALGSIGRDDPAVVAALLGRLRSGTPAMRCRVAECLLHAGPALAGRVDEAVAILIDLSRSEIESAYNLPDALGSVGRDREDALEVLLELASPRPPQWVADEYGVDGRRDATTNERGLAVSALRFFPSFADRIVPALIEAMDSFEEYDPDYTYNGEHERVCHVLAALGPAAAPATGRLVEYLDGYLKRWNARTEDADAWPKAVFDALAAIGPAASAALPALEALRRRAIESESDPAPPLDRDDQLDRAILAIRGEIDRPTFPTTGR